jgi:hypothetical protein
MCKKCFIIRIMRDISGAIRISECLIDSLLFPTAPELHRRVLLSSEFNEWSDTLLYALLTKNLLQECCRRGGKYTEIDRTG